MDLEKNSWTIWNLEVRSPYIQNRKQFLKFHVYLEKYSIIEGKTAVVLWWDGNELKGKGLKQPLPKKRKAQVKSKNIILSYNIIQLSLMKTENGVLVKPCSLSHIFLNVQEKRLRKNISILVSAHKASWILKQDYRGIFFQNTRKKLISFQLSNFSRSFSVYFLINSTIHIEYKFAAE